MNKNQTQNTRGIANALRIAIALAFRVAAAAESAAVRIATFDLDVTPPVGSWMAYDPVTSTWDMGLRARGIILIGAEQPIVVCAIDWIGVAMKAMMPFAKRSPARSAPLLLAFPCLPSISTTRRIAISARTHSQRSRPTSTKFRNHLRSPGTPTSRSRCPRSVAHAQPVTQLGLGQAQVYEIASNRRVMGSGALWPRTRSRGY
jgi:hypothetical protein